MLHQTKHSWVRIVFEKPFGRDLASARELTRRIKRFCRNQISASTTISAKKTVQNILNVPIRQLDLRADLQSHTCEQHSDHVAENIGMEGRRGAYYDTAGAMRDIGAKTNALQLLLSDDDGNRRLPSRPKRFAIER
jgi:glucose-6-phosphate 1-dehydrogenase